MEKNFKFYLVGFLADIKILDMHFFIFYLNNIFWTVATKVRFPRKVIYLRFEPLVIFLATGRNTL